MFHGEMWTELFMMDLALMEGLLQPDVIGGVHDAALRAGGKKGLLHG